MRKSWNPGSSFIAGKSKVRGKEAKREERESLYFGDVIMLCSLFFLMAYETMNSLYYFYFNNSNVYVSSYMIFCS